jgi:hypothetical protein
LKRTEVIEIDQLDGADGVRYLADDAWTIIENTPEAGEAWVQLFHYGRKDGEHPGGRRGKSVPSIHMPRWASRITLAVEAVRVQPLSAMTSEDALAEGIYFEKIGFTAGPLPEGQSWSATPEIAYRVLWRSLHGSGSLDADPEVVALSFRVLRGNVDQVQP